MCGKFCNVCGIHYNMYEQGIRTEYTGDVQLNLNRWWISIENFQL